MENFIVKVVTSATNIYYLIQMEGPYPLIPRAPNQDELDNGGRGLAWGLSPT